MQFELDKSASLAIRSYVPGELLVGQQRITAPVILTTTAVHAGWSPPAISLMSIADFEPVLQHRPEVVLFGTDEATRWRVEVL